MKELEFIKIINNITDNDYLGDDCAYLKDFGIVVTQDNFVEDVHFKRAWATPYQIGYKATAVNISDVLAAGAEPKYLSIGLSLPKDIDNKFVEEFYKGVLSAANGAKVIGGDITGSEKIFVSITAIGSTVGRKISSRANAKVGYIVIASSEHGMSSKGLQELINGGNNTEMILSHLEPKLDKIFSEEISTNIKDDYAMMDTSDGLADALFKIAQASNVKIVVKSGVKGLYGAEDYKLVAAVPANYLTNITDYIIVADVVKFDGCYLQVNDKSFSSYDELELFDHFSN